MQARILDGDKLRTTTSPADIRAALAANQRIWIDLERQSPDADALLADVLKLHPLTIEEHVWIGHGSHVLKGVTIGRGAVVAAGSVVTSDVPSGALAMGVPARILRQPW